MYCHRDPVIKRGGLAFPEYIGGDMKLQHQSGFITLKLIITPIIEKTSDDTLDYYSYN